MDLHLPEIAVSDRISIKRFLKPGEKYDYAVMEGPGCIRHMWVTPTREEDGSRDTVLRIFFDDMPVPYVEAPIGDFFGVMHGKKFYPMNTPFITATAECGYDCYFEMPFAQSARIELEGGEKGKMLYFMVDWHRYPEQEMTETRRFCARWRREMPTQRYGEDYVILDADGPGQLLGFVYGVRLIDNTDRWSHGGGDNIYIDGMGEYPAYIRGIGGEDTFGVGFGGALHNPPETYLYHGMPYYVHEDTGEARPAQRVVGYRFFVKDEIHFWESVHMRFGSMCNDICSVAYWYQEKPVRPFFVMPGFKYLRPQAMTEGNKLPRCTNDLPLPAGGEWWLCGPFYNREDRAMKIHLEAEKEFDPRKAYDGLQEEGSLWLTESSREVGKDRARWVKRAAIHGFIDFRHVFRPNAKSVAPTETGVALARCVLNVHGHKKAVLRIAWDDVLTLRLNGEIVCGPEKHTSFREKKIEVSLTTGPNIVLLKLSNDLGSNHGGWAFACKVLAEDGTVLLPSVE